VIDSQPNRNEQGASWGHPEPEPRLGAVVNVPRSNAEAVAAGLVYLLQERRNGRWGHLNLPWGAADAAVTACVLARLGELPSHFMNRYVRGAIADSLDWLQAAQIPEGGWGYLGESDAETTAWAVIALRKHGRRAPDCALDIIRRCRRPDGGFGRNPEAVSSVPETTALAIQALGASESSQARDAAGFLSYWLENGTDRLASSLFVCSAVLEWEKGFAPVALVNQACQLATGFQAESAFDQALLLRCLIRLRLNRAWSLAASLRTAQLADGSWPGSPAARFNFDDKRIVPTVTAVSSLILGDFQPGLYFGSDLPRPRRLQEF
jgi:Prenyltransferase and squalene oxidase repeat